MHRALLFLWLLTVFVGCKDNKNYDTIAYLSKIDSLEQTTQYLNYSLLNTFKHEAQIIERNLELLEIGTKDTIGINEIDFSNKLVLFITDRACTQCTYEQLDLLSDINPNSDKLIYIGWFQNPRTLFIIKEKYQIDNPIYLLVNETSLVSKYNHPGPYYLRIIGDGQISSFFSPIKGNSSLTHEYLNNFTINQ